MKKLFSFFFTLVFFSLNFFAQNLSNINLLTSLSFPPKEIENIKIETTYENLEIVESYSPELSIELFGNNNKILPKIITEEKSLSILSISKKTTPGDFCKIVLYIPTDFILNKIEIKTGQKTNNKISLLNFKTNLLDIETYDSNINCSFVDGNIKIKTVNGNINFDNINSENTSLLTKNGIINLKNAKICQFSALSDSKNINIDNLTSEYLLIKTLAGPISADNLICDYFDIQSESSNISISLKQVPDATSNIKSNSGFVQLFIPTFESFSLEVHSNSGTFFNKLEKKRFTPRHTFKKDYKNGGATISVKTFSGDIEIDEL